MARLIRATERSVANTSRMAVYSCNTAVGRRVQCRIYFEIYAHDVETII